MNNKFRHFYRAFRIIYGLRKTWSLGDADEKNMVEKLAHEACDYFFVDPVLNRVMNDYVTDWGIRDVRKEYTTVAHCISR